MSDREKSDPPRSGNKRRNGMWAVAGAACAFLFIYTTENVLLDADDDDISYHRSVRGAYTVTNPQPGDVFVFDHRRGDFIESRLCSLQLIDKPMAETASVRALNVWGSAINATLEAMAEYVPDKVREFAMIDNPVREWKYDKVGRPQMDSDMQKNCQMSVERSVAKRYETPFLVDTVYRVKNEGDERGYVSFVGPLVFEELSCKEDCPPPASLSQAIRHSRSAAIKARLGIIKVQ